MAELQLDIKSIQDQESALTIAQVFLDSAIDEKGLRKEFVHNFFTNVLNNLESQSASPKTKFYSIFIIKELSLKDKVTLKIFGTFSQHPLYNYLQELALTVDPKKPISEKGKGLYPADKQTGNNLMRLLLQSLVTWGTKFPTNSKKEPTRFKKTLTHLNDQKVTLPKEFVYYQQNQKKSEKTQTPQGPKQSKQSKQPKSNKGVSNQSISYTPSAPSVKQPKQKLVGDIKFMYNKIETLLGILEDSDSLQQIQRQVQSYHLKFEKDLQKLEQIQGDMLQNKDQKLVQLYFKIFQFFNQERQLFKAHASKNEYDVYVSGYTIAYEKIFQQKKSEIKKPSKNQPSIDKKMSEPKSVSNIKPGMPPPPQKKPQKIQSNQQRVANDKENIKKVSEKDAQVAKPRESRITDNKHVIQSCFNKLENFSKSPHQGFGSIAKSLGKQKQKTTTASRLKTSNIANLTKSKYTGASNYSKSTVKLKGIFAEPPNRNVKPKTYQGQLVIENEQLMRQNDKIRKDQGIRRLKASLFKTKYILYEDQAIQIGFKSAPIYEQVQKFQVMLNFEIFFGNKTKNNINKFHVSFQGDKQSLIYTNPQTVQSTIAGQSQAKLDLLNIPKDISFGLITLNASYELHGQKCSIIALLPNSILQMAVYFDLDQEKASAIWNECPKILKTELFKLSHYFPPDQFTHLLPKLKEKISYSRFAQEGSTLDYQLFCEVVLQQKYEGVVKIIVRPDLNVVLQAAVYTTEEDCIYTFKFYLQSLQMALAEVEG